MKAPTDDSKDVLVFVGEGDTLSKKNEIKNKPTACYKFNSILKILVYLLLGLVLIRIGYGLLIFYMTAEMPSIFCGTMTSVIEDEIIVQPIDQLKIMTSEEREELFLGRRTIFLGFVDELEDNFKKFTTAETATDIATTKSSVDGELPVSTVASTTDNLVVTTLITDFDAEDKEKKTIEVSDIDEIVTDSSEFSDRFDNIENFEIPSSEITWLVPGVFEDSSKETNEELDSAEWIIFSSSTPISILTHDEADEADESNEKSKSTSYDKSFTSIKTGDDIVDADSMNFKDVEVFYTNSKVPITSKCKISLDERDEICESDEEISMDTESPLSATRSTDEDYYDYYSDRDSAADYDTGENEEEVKEEIQWENMEEEQKQDNVSEKVVDDENSEVTEDYSDLSTKRQTEDFPYWLMFRTTPEVENPTDSPSSIGTESSDIDDDVISHEDNDIDESWDTLTVILGSIEKDTISDSPYSEEIETIYIKMVCVLLDKYLQDIVTNPAFNLTDQEQLALTTERTKVLDAAGYDGDYYDSVLNQRIVALLRGDWEKNEKVKRSIEYMSKNHENLTGRLSDEEKVTKTLRNAIQMEEVILVQKMGQIDDSDYKSLESSLEKLFDRMEFVSQHIDRLHNRYLEFNELNDDYVSREFLMGSPM